MTLDGFSFDYPGTHTLRQRPVWHCDREQRVLGLRARQLTAYQITSAIGVNAAPSTAITGNYFTSPGSTDGAVQFFNGGCTDTVVSDNTFYAAANDGLGTIFFYCDGETRRPTSRFPATTTSTSGTRTERARARRREVNGDVDVTDNTVTTSTYERLGDLLHAEPVPRSGRHQREHGARQPLGAVMIRTGGGSGSGSLRDHRQRPVRGRVRALRRRGLTRLRRDRGVARQRPLRQFEPPACDNADRSRRQRRRRRTTGGAATPARPARLLRGVRRRRRSTRGSCSASRRRRARPRRPGARL